MQVRNDARFSVLRKEFESLEPGGKFNLLWASRPPLSLVGGLPQSQWTWAQVTDESLLARFRAIAFKAARARGYESEYGWFDELRQADFVEFEINGGGRWNQPDGTVYEWETGKLHDALKHSITLCYLLEAGQTISRQEVVGDRTGATDAEGPNATGKGRKRGPKPNPDMASRVAEIVMSVAPKGEWRSKLDDISEALDEAQIPIPPRWRKNRDYRSWGDCSERPLLVKAIEYRLRITQQPKKATPETSS